MEMTPKQVVTELNRYIIGQTEAKKMVAVALRNRYRRSCLPNEIKEEITPKNIIMKGPTGVGKTEIARRLSKIIRSPFVKVEATKFTEVGYVGRDVDTMIRDLVEVSIRMVKEEKISEIKPRIQLSVIRKIASQLKNTKKSEYPHLSDDELLETLSTNVDNGLYDEDTIQVEVTEGQKQMQVAGVGGIELNIGDMFGGLLNNKKKKAKKFLVKDAKRILFDEEAEGMIDNDSVIPEALRRAEQDGIVFIDEIDKIAARGNTSGADVSREGVQRDILPLIEGCSVSTKYGSIKTDYILFIAAGAFHVSSIDDLIPELQGRFPVRVELENLTAKDFVEILSSTDNALLRQYTALMRVDNVDLKFTKEAIETMAEIAQTENENSENLGARRLHGILELLLEDISFNAGGLTDLVEIIIDKKYVYERLAKSAQERNLRKYII